jgi:hypothetical protein
MGVGRAVSLALRDLRHVISPVWQLHAVSP